MPDGTVIVGSRDGYLYAVKADGTLKWKYQTDEAIDQSSPAAGSDGTIYIGSWDNCLHAVNPATGEVKWKFKGAEGTYGMVSSPSVGAGGTIYIGSTDTWSHRLPLVQAEPSISEAPTLISMRSVLTAKRTGDAKQKELLFHPPR